jgi:dihydrodipicolinate synthase/N-acetylneuraminate lyase
MTVETPALLEALNNVTAIPIIPFRNGEVDYDAHAMNVAYLMHNNALDGNRPRVVSVAGTSLIHHIEPEEQTRLFDVTGQVMGKDGILMSAIVPNPIKGAGKLVEEQSKLNRPPDVYLVMPLNGTFSPEGVYEHFMAFGQRYGEEVGARFIYYHRQARDMEAVLRLLNDSPHFIGVKVGTGEADVKPMIEGVGENAMVIWGIGDRTAAPKPPSKGQRATRQASPYFMPRQAMRSTTRNGGATLPPPKPWRPRSTSWRKSAL